VVSANFRLAPLYVPAIYIELSASIKKFVPEFWRAVLPADRRFQQ